MATKKGLRPKMLEAHKKLEGKTLKKTESGYANRYKYYDINSVREMLREALNEVGLVVMQPLSTRDGVDGISVVVVDPDTGEREESWIKMDTISDPQKNGSMITYYRRYSLVSFFGLEAEDDDGQSAKRTFGKEEYDKLKQNVETGKAPDINRLRTMLKGANIEVSKDRGKKIKELYSLKTKDVDGESNKDHKPTDTQGSRDTGIT